LRRVALGLAATTGALFLLTGCHIDMWVQKKNKAQSASEFFADGAGSRLPVTHTIARGGMKTDEQYFTGYTGGQVAGGKLVGAQYVDTIPLAAYKGFDSDTHKMLVRGRERFDIFCSPCHGKMGDGKGMIALRGFNAKRPVGNYHTVRLRNMPIGHFYDVITNGYGTMTPRAFQVEQPDRWAIAAYIRVLQTSQNAQPNDLTPEDQQKMSAPAGSVVKE
jgi:mono/diheme cytochrome c family protein